MRDQIDASRLTALREREARRFVTSHPRAGEHAARAARTLLGGVPMTWMRWWAGAYPIVAAEASGARVRDIDGHEYVDFCLGEGAAMCGHAPAAVVAALRAQAERGLTHMLPGEDAIWIGEELGRRFGLPRWQFTLSATDANRFALRLARAVTGRARLVVFAGYYHGTLDDAPGDWDAPRAADPATTVLPFNDLDRLEATLAREDVALVMAEPALTNVGIVLPDPEFHEALRELTARTGTLLLLDEAHTISAGPGGCTRAWSLEPDIVTLGKPIAGGVAAGAFGVSAEIARRIDEHGLLDATGIGGTVAGNPLQLAAMRATLAKVLIDDAWAAMEDVATGAERELTALFDHHRLPWRVTRLGCRLDYRFAPQPARDAAGARAALDAALSGYLRLAEINRGFLLAPFLGNMLLLSPATTPDDVTRYVAMLDAVLGELAG